MKQFKTLQEVVNHLYSGLSDEDKEFIKNKGIQNPWFGMQLRNSFGLWWSPDNYKKYRPSFWKRFWLKITGKGYDALVAKDKPPLVQWFHDNGLYHADDMSLAIQESFKAKVRGEEFNTQTIVERVNTHWKREGIDPKSFKQG